MVLKEGVWGTDHPHAMCYTEHVVVGVLVVLLLVVLVASRGTAINNPGDDEA